jgi:hypothetical protein
MLADIDPCTTRDPLDQNDDCAYSVVLDRSNFVRMISLIATKPDPASPLPWGEMLQDTFLCLQMSKEEASVLKQELMPKNNSFCPYRRSTKIAFYVMFASQIRGIH